MAISPLAFAPTSLMKDAHHAAIMEKRFPETLRERFIYYTAIDPRLSETSRKVGQIALVALATLLYIVTLGMGALFVHNTIQIYNSYREISSSLQNQFLDSDNNFQQDLPSLKKLWHQEILSQKAPQNFVERFIYYSAIDPRLSKTSEKIMQVVLVLFATLIYLGTLGLGALFVHKSIQTYHHFRDIKKSVIDSCNEDVKKINDTIALYNAHQSPQVFQETCNLLTKRAEEGKIRRALFLAQFYPEVKIPPFNQTTRVFCEDILTNNTRSQLFVSIKDYFIKRGRFVDAEAVLSYIRPFSECYKALALMNCEHKFFARAFEYTCRLDHVNPDMAVHTAAIIFLAQLRFADAFEAVKDIKHLGLQIASLTTIYFKIPSNNVEYFGLKAQLLSALSSALSSLDLAKDDPRNEFKKTLSILEDTLKRELACAAAFSSLLIDIQEGAFAQVLNNWGYYKENFPLKYIQDIFPLIPSSDPLYKALEDHIREKSGPLETR